MPSPGVPPSWDDVLSAVEADLARTAELVQPAADVEPAAALAPAVTRLPSGLTAAPVLPALTAMPPVPTHLAERIDGLRQHIEALQSQLRAELAALDGLRAEQAAHAVRAARFATARRLATPGPALFDSRV